MHTCKESVANGVAVHVGVLSLTKLPDQSWLIRLCMHDTVVPCTYMYMYMYYVHVHVLCAWHLLWMLLNSRHFSYPDYSQYPVRCTCNTGKMSRNTSLPTSLPTTLSWRLIEGFWRWQWLSSLIRFQPTDALPAQYECCACALQWKL